MKKRNKMYIMIGLAVTILVLVGTSYAWWTSTATQTGINEVQSSCIKVAIQNEEGNIKLQNAYPLTDEQAEELTPYKFTITNTCKTIVDYTVKLEKLLQTNGQEKDLLKSEYIAVEFNGGQKELLSNYPTGKTTYEGEGYTSKEARELIKGTLNGSDTKTYTIKLWMDESVTATEESMNKSFISKIVVDGSLNELAVYNEPKLHGADPVLGNEGSKEEVAMLSTLAEEEPTTNDKLIPVIISDNGTVTRANLAHEWYNYEEKKWANAVILTDTAEEPEVGAEILEKDIESYFVWIPKYKYKIFDMGKYDKLATAEELIDKGPNTAIEIIFGGDDTTNEGTTNGESECESPKVSGEDGKCAVGKWMTHPAFLAFPESEGLWVGKFETGYNQSEDGSLKDTTGWSKTGAEQNQQVPEKVIIKPNVYSWRKINLANMYQTSFNYERKLESHMMKNTEWGAVAYLTQSIYGRCNQEDGQVKCENVRLNNHKDYATGYVAVNAPNLGTGLYKDTEAVTLGQNGNNICNYTNPSSVNASTTGNYSGIYDMSGGAWDSTMSLPETFILSTSTGFTNDTKPSTQYIDIYNIESKHIYNEHVFDYTFRILGDAIGEMGPFAKSSTSFTSDGREISSWYKNLSWLSNVVISRGGAIGDGAAVGVFAMGPNSGHANYDYVTFRIVLAP